MPAQENPVNSLIRTAHLLAKMGLGTSTSGNLSVRSGNKIFFTATGVSMAKTAKKNLAAADLSGKPLNCIPPTKEAGFHLAILRQRPEVNAIIHVHPAHAIAVSMLLEPGKEAFVPSATPQFVMRAGRVPVMPYFPPGDVRIADAAKEVCAGKGFLMQNHGATVFAGDFEKALHILEELEENCRILLLTSNRGRVLIETEIGNLETAYPGKK
jgi:3-dehydro-4-phosphotetronate decarboxylase